jgi:CheY-like chemotaxis protein
MIRPCYLVIDREYATSISTRKLVIETAKLNVITCYSGREALETLEKFPRVDGVILDGGIDDIHCSELLAQIKQRLPALPVIVVMTPTARACEGADYTLETFDAARLLDLLRSLHPEAAARIEKRNEELKAREE